MPKVLITPSTLNNAQGPHLPILRDAGFEVVFPARAAQLTEEEIIRNLPGVSAVLAGSEPYTRRALETTSDLRIIARVGVGYDAVDMSAANERGVIVTITPGANQDAVAEHTFSLMLALAKKVVPQHVAIQAGRWPRHATVPLRNRVLGIAGLGRIGKAVAIRGASFGMQLAAFEPYPDREFAARHNIRLISFDQLLRESDYLSLHLPMSPETKHLINRKTLAVMKPSAYLINTARGKLVCEADLIEALRGNRLAGAGLDVFEEEPPGSSSLFAMENVVLTAHTAGVDTQSLQDMAVSGARSIAALSRGEWPEEQIVNRELKERFRW